MNVLAREPVVPCYVVVDTSGSTFADRWIDATNAMLPLIVQTLEGDGPPPRSLCLVSFADTAEVRSYLSDASSVESLPAFAAGGFSSLASAFCCLADVIGSDLTQLKADGMIPETPIGVFVLHGLPTDPPDRLLAARATLKEACPGLRSGVVTPAETDILSLEGLSLGRRSLVNGPIDLARTVMQLLADLAS